MSRSSRGREGVKVITSDSLTPQESIGVSGDRQSASELARLAAVTPKDQTKIENDDFRLYQAQQQLAQQPRPAHDLVIQKQAFKQEEYVRSSHVGFGI